MATRKTTARKETVKRVGLADPRTGPEKLLAMANKVASGNRRQKTRTYDDSPTELAKKVRESRARQARKKK